MTGVPARTAWIQCFSGVAGDMLLGALLGMLASCASGLTVVGIDNGFGAACAVARALAVRVTSA